MTQSQLEAYDDIQKTLSPREQRIIEIYRQHPDGLTAWETAEIAKFSPFPHRQDVHPRINRLVESEILVETGTKRMTCTGKTGEVYMYRPHWEHKETAQAATCTIYK